MSLAYIRRNYGVPARRGARVLYQGKPAVITSGPRAYLRLRFENEKRATRKVYHPTWQIKYL